MALLRAFLLVFTLAFSFVIAVPLQAILVRRGPRMAARLPLLFCRLVLRILRVSVEVEGLVADGGPVLLAANHVSWIDVLALGSLTPFCFLAKHEVASWPILSRLAVVQGTVFVDRRTRRGILPANRAMADRMLGGRKVLLFPEGTTFDGTVLGPFFPSHFAAARDLLRRTSAASEVAVQPVAVVYSSVEAAWVGDEALLPHIWRVLRQDPMRCLIVFDTPITYRDVSDRKIVSRSSRDAIARMVSRARASHPIYAWPRAAPVGHFKPA